MNKGEFQDLCVLNSEEEAVHLLQHLNRNQIEYNIVREVGGQELRTPGLIEFIRVQLLASDWSRAEAILQETNRPISDTPYETLEALNPVADKDAPSSALIEQRLEILLRHRRNALIFSLAVIPAVFSTYVAGRAGIVILIVVGVMGSFFNFRLLCIRCPRCNRHLHNVRYGFNYFASHCLHCKLPLR